MVYGNHRWTFGDFTVDRRLPCSELTVPVMFVFCSFAVSCETMDVYALLRGCFLRAVLRAVKTAVFLFRVQPYSSDLILFRGLRDVLNPKMH